EVVGRVSAEDVPAVTEAICGIWESVRRNGESLGQTVQRVGHNGFAAHLEAVLARRWATGPEDAPDVTAATTAAASRPVATASDDEYVTVARADAIAPGSAATVVVAGQAVALVNTGDTFCAVADTCPHAGGSLGGGTVDRWSLSCPSHGATFDVRSGEALAGPADGPVPVYPVRVENGDLQVAPHPAVPASVG
ncbi:MAG TPA: Rieske 2Fe-2S domain-containing protein, partial [Acidimicrobiales bacterium]